MQDLFRGKHACCFTGHRPHALPDRGDEAGRGMRALICRLDEAVRAALDAGVTTFLVGGALGFDTLAAESVLALSAASSCVSLVLALPGRDQAEGWSDADAARYEAIRFAASEVVYAADRCDKLSMQARNRYLVEHADCCVAYLRLMRGGTLYTVSYALDRGIPVLNLAERLTRPGG